MTMRELAAALERAVESLAPHVTEQPIREVAGCIGRRPGGEKAELVALGVYLPETPDRWVLVFDARIEAKDRAGWCQHFDPLAERVLAESVPQGGY